MAMPRRCWPPRSSISAPIPSARPSGIFRPVASRCGCDRRETMNDHRLEVLAVSPTPSRRERPRSPRDSYTAKLLAQGRRRLRQETRRGGGRDRAGRRLRRQAPDRRRSGRPALSPRSSLLAATGRRPGRGDGGTRTPRRHQRACRKGQPPEELIMEELAKEVSPFRRFSREEWAALRADTPMTLTRPTSTSCAASTTAST